MLLKHGHKRVTGFEVRRRPLASPISKLIDLVTKGKAKTKLKAQGFDDFYHLWGNITLDDGTKLMTEKNQTLHIKEAHATDGIKSPFPVDVSQGKTLKEMFEAAEANIGKENFYRYDPLDANCQRFITGLLSSTGMDNPRTRAWTNQNIREALSADTGDTWYTSLGKRVTDFASVVSRGLEKIGL